MKIKLTVGEKILIARNRKGFGRLGLGKAVYLDHKIKKLDHPDGRIKKIEIGRIKPKNFIENEIETIAKVLNVPGEFFNEDYDESDLCLSKEFRKDFQNIQQYIDLLNSTIQIDESLCVTLFERIAIYMQETIDKKNSKLTL